VVAGQRKTVLLTKKYSYLKPDSIVLQEVAYLKSLGYELIDDIRLVPAKLK